MSKFCVFSMSLITSVVLIHAMTVKNTVDGIMGHNIHITKRSIGDEESYFQKITNFFGGKRYNKVDSKPDFVTTFDIIRLLNEDYAMKQFYCVINEIPCDSVGLRLKASIPEAINRNCRRCTSTESNNIRRIVNYVKKNYPEFWKRVEPIYKNK